MISQRIDQIRRNIACACALEARNPDEIVIIAVTKYAVPEQIQQAISAGVMDIGENKVQDAAKKFSALQEKQLDFKRHMIGHLQTNKVKEAVRIFDVIQSVDSVKIAEQIDRHAAAADKTMEILLQVNSSYEQQKFGFDPADVISAIESIQDNTHIRVAGLMTIGALIDDSQMIEQCFMQTRTLFDQIKQKFSGHPRVSMTYLSMGMSHDYQIAIRCGANMVRIGSAIFS